MSALEVVQSHLEALVMQLLEIDDLVVDDDGDICWRSGEAQMVARVRRYGGKVQPHIRVYAVAVCGVGLDPGLLEAVNASNARLSHARLWWSEERLVVGGELHGVSTELPAFGCLCSEIATWVNTEAAGLAATFGGHLPFGDTGES